MTKKALAALSKDSEKRLLNALEKISSLMSAGEEPTDALVKVADEMQVPVGHIQLLVNAVNTGITNAHRLSHSDTLEKAADIPLADSFIALQRLYPETTNKKASVISDDYFKATKWIEAMAVREKQSSVINWKMTDKPLPAVEIEDTRIKKALSKIKILTNNIEQKRLKLAYTRNRATQLISDLRDYFISPGHIAFKEVNTNAQIMFGKQASAVLSSVKPHREDSVSTHKQVNINLAPYSLINSAIKLAAEFKKNKEEYEIANKKANQEVQEIIAPFAPGPETGRSVMGNLSLQSKEAFLGGFFGNAAGIINAGNVAKEMAKRLPGQVTRPEQWLEQKDLQNLIDPAHESEIRNIQSEAMLNDLMANDDVVRGYDPEEVLDAFNEVSQLAPYAANKKVLMRDLLRRRLAGGPQALDQFAMTDTLKQQESLRNLNTMPDSSMKLLTEVGVLPGVSNQNKSVLR